MERTPRRARRFLTLITTGARITIGALAASAAIALGTPSADAEPQDPGRWQDQAGPAVFHEPAPRAPQFENTGIWQAESTQVCMTSAYRSSEFLYQGCLWDDQGAGVALEWPLNSLLKTYSYPTDPAYRANAADLVELRAKPLTDATAFRLTYNTMTDAELVATTIALGDSDRPKNVPHGANTKMPAEVFVTVHGDEAELVDAATGDELGTVAATVDLERRQVEVRVPHDVFDPTGQTDVRLGAGTGLWNAEDGRYLIPGLLATETKPGGAVVNVLKPSAFFDVAFRYDEPLDSAWRNRQQKITLMTGDISKFYAEVDFTKLAGGVDDDMTGERGGVPKTGYIQRIYATHHELEQGRRVPSDPGGPPLGAFTQQDGLNLTVPDDEDALLSGQFGWICREECVPDLPGQLQRYIAYVPDIPAPDAGYGSLTFTPGYAMTPGDFVSEKDDLYQKVADRKDAATIVMSVDARGADNWFYGSSGSSVFEAIADLERHYSVDPDRRMMGGFSSGAYGANKLSLQFPDFFSKAFICDGLNKAPSLPLANAIGDTLPFDTITQHEAGSTLTPLLPSRRNQPVMEWAGLPDDFIPTIIPAERAAAYRAGDYDYAFETWVGLSGSHLILCDNGTWDVFTEWAGTGQRIDDPAHVTYVRNPLMDDEEFGLVGDRAYWLSDIQTRSTDGETGTIDVFSRGFGKEDPEAGSREIKIATEEGTTVPINPYTSERRTLAEPKTSAVRDELEIEASNIGTVTIDPQQAQVSCDAKLNVTTDGPLQVKLAGCGEARNFS